MKLPDHLTKERGFTLVEVLVVLAISSMLLSVLMTSMTSSSQVLSSISKLDERNSASIFFDEQFSALVRSINGTAHPDIALQNTAFNGTSSGFSGAFHNEFVEDRTVMPFSVIAQQGASGKTEIFLRYGDGAQNYLWFRSKEQASFKYVDDRARLHARWPVSPQRSAQGGRAMLDKLPRAIIIEFKNRETASQKLFLLNE